MSDPVIELPELDVTDPESITAELEWKLVPQHLAQAKLYSAIGHRICRERQLLEKMAELATANAQIAELEARETPEKAYSRGFSVGVIAEDGDTCFYITPPAKEKI